MLLSSIPEEASEAELQLQTFLEICSIVFSATLGGYFTEGARDVSYHLYVARAYDGLEIIPVRQTHSQHHWAVSFQRGTNNFIKSVSRQHFTQKYSMVGLVNYNVLVFSLK